MIIPIVVVLPAPLPPSNAVVEPTVSEKQSGRDDRLQSFDGRAHEASGRRLWRLVLERSLTVDRRSSPSSPLSAIDSWIRLSTFQVVVSGVLVFIIRIAIGSAYNYPTTP
jgi:hypothetical protein